MRSVLAALATATLTTLFVPAGASSDISLKLDSPTTFMNTNLGGYYAEEGACGGNAPIVLACTALPMDAPMSATAWGYRIYGCSDVTNCFLMAHIDMDIVSDTGSAHAWCDQDAPGVWSCGDTSEGAFHPGHEFQVTGYVSNGQLICIQQCTPNPVVGDWGVELYFT